MSNAIRVLIVDDSAFMRQTLRRMLDGKDSIQVVGTVANGRLAIAEAERLKPDVITLDIEMPEMDGLTALPRLLRVCQARILMVSSLTVDGSHAALTAMRLGADDFLAKDQSQISLNLGPLEDELLLKVRTLGRNNRHRTMRSITPSQSSAASLKLSVSDYDVMLIGSSTGGPPVLETIITSLPKSFPLPVVIAQHMPAMFTATMAERLDETSELNVLHGQPNLPVSKGHVYVAMGGQHTRLRRRAAGGYRLEVSPEPTNAPYRPSVNELFASGAETFGKRVLAIVLTGMGDDGLVGAQLLREKGATILAQDADSCVVYGMPKVVTQAGLVAANLNPSQFVQALKGLGTPSVRHGATA